VAVDGCPVCEGRDIRCPRCGQECGGYTHDPDNPAEQLAVLTSEITEMASIALRRHPDGTRRGVTKLDRKLWETRFLKEV